MAAFAKVRNLSRFSLRDVLPTIYQTIDDHLQIALASVGGAYHSIKQNDISHEQTVPFLAANQTDYAGKERAVILSFRRRAKHIRPSKQIALSLWMNSR